MTDNSSPQFLYQEVEQHVRDLIASKTLTPGDRLPSLRKMSTKLGASISTVSQAYMELERKGFIEARPRSGFFVSSPRKLPTPSQGEAPSTPRHVNRGKLIATVLEAVGNKELVPYGVVCPTDELLPSRTLSRILAQVVRENPSKALKYEAIPGSLDLRRQIVMRGLDHGVHVTPDCLVITGGAMEALYISLRATTRPGDTVLIQSPAYYCFLQLMETLGLRAIEIPCHPDTGIAPADVADALTKFDITACILAPNFSNPDGSLTPDAAKREITEILAKSEIPLVEDDVYGDLYFEGKRPSPFKQYDTTGNVILCSSFSKTIGPGYRVGWMQPGRFLEKTLQIKATTNISTPSPSQMAITEFLRRGLYEKHLRRLRAGILKQRDTMLYHIERYFPEGTRATHPRGGSVLWLELPKGVDSVEYFYEAKAHGIGIAPGAIFSMQEKFQNFIRLTMGGIWDERMDNGLKTLGKLADKQTASSRGA